MNKAECDAKPRRSEDFQLRQLRVEADSSQPNEPFNLLKRVILLEERTRQFEESQVHLSFLEQRVDELAQKQNGDVSTDRQRLIYDLEKKFIIMDDKICDFEGKYNKLFESIQNEIQGHLEEPLQQMNLQQEISQLYEIVSNLDKSCQARWSQMKEELEKNGNITQTSLKSLQTRLDKQESNERLKKELEDQIIPYKSSALNSLSESKRPDSFDPKRYEKLYNIETRLNTRDQILDPKPKTETISLNQDTRLDSRLIETRMLLINNNKDSKSMGQSMGQSMNQSLGQSMGQSVSHIPQQLNQSIKTKEDEIDQLRHQQAQLLLKEPVRDFSGFLLKEPTRDLSGFRATGGVRPNPYKQRDLTNVRERISTQPQEIHWDTDIKLEQTKRFIDDEISRRFKEDFDKKNNDQKHLPYSSLREQLNNQYQKRYI